MAQVQISCKIFLIKIDCFYLDFYFFYIKNSDLQIFQIDQVKYCLKTFAKHQICLFLQCNILSSLTKNAKPCSSHSREASKKQKHPLGLTNLPFSVRNLAEHTILPFPGYTSTIQPKGQCDLAVCSTGRYMKYLSFGISLSISRSTKVVKYSLIHLCQNILVADCTFFHLTLSFISNWLKFRGGKFVKGEPNRKWFGVLASKWSILSLVSVSGRLIADSTSHRKVVNESQ